MPLVRKIFGWLFGLVSIICLGVAILTFRLDLIRAHGAPRPTSIMVFGVLVLFAFVFAMAWWTTWKARPTAQAWGIAASLVNMSVPISLMYFRHRRLTDSHWKTAAFSVLALIAFAWPESDKDDLSMEHFGDDDSTS